MRVTEDELEKSAVAPLSRAVTLEDVAKSVTAVYYFTAKQGVLGELASDGVSSQPLEEGRIPVSLGLLTFCVLVLKNGFTVTGQSACADPGNYNPGIGQRIARENAYQQIWPLLGYELRTRLSLVEGG